jgi:hypothetical protein
MALPKAFAPGAVPTHKAALARARDLGCKVKVGNGGEVRVSYRFADRTLSVNCNNRRHDASRALLALIRDLERQNGLAR